MVRRSGEARPTRVMRVVDPQLRLEHAGRQRNLLVEKGGDLSRNLGHQPGGSEALLARVVGSALVFDLEEGEGVPTYWRLRAGSTPPPPWCSW